jgi:hypothetical protein
MHWLFGFALIALHRLHQSSQSSLLKFSFGEKHQDLNFWSAVKGKAMYFWGTLRNQKECNQRQRLLLASLAWAIKSRERKQETFPDCLYHEWLSSQILECVHQTWPQRKNIHTHTYIIVYIYISLIYYTYIYISLSLSMCVCLFLLVRCSY